MSIMSLEINHHDPLPTTSRKKFNITVEDNLKEASQKNVAYLKTISSLSQQLEREKIKTQELEKEIDRWKFRLLERQKQLRGIISNIDLDREQSIVDHKSKIPSNISNLHTEVKNKIQQTNQETLKYLQTKQNANLEHIDKKLEALRKEMEEKLNKHKVLTMDNLKEILTEIDDVRTMAMDIDIENKKLTNDLKELRIKNKVLIEERNIAVHETVINNMRMRDQMKRDKFNKAEEKKNKSVSLSVSQEFEKNYGFNSFLGEPIFDSPTLKRRKTAETPQAVISEEKERQSIILPNRSITKQRKRNTNGNSLFLSQNKSRLEQSIDISKRSTGKNNKIVNTTLLQYFLSGQEAVKNKGYRHLNRPPMRSKRATIDLMSFNDSKQL